MEKKHGNNQLLWAIIYNYSILTLLLYMIIHVNHIIHINHIIHVWPIVFSLSCGAFPAPSAWPGACCHAKKCDGGPKGEGCREELGKTW